MVQKTELERMAALLSPLSNIAALHTEAVKNGAILSGKDNDGYGRNTTGPELAGSGKAVEGVQPDAGLVRGNAEQERSDVGVQRRDQTAQSRNQGASQEMNNTQTEDTVVIPFANEAILESVKNNLPAVQAPTADKTASALEDALVQAQTALDKIKADYAEGQKQMQALSYNQYALQAQIQLLQQIKDKAASVPN